MFVGVGATIAIAYACGMKFSGIDGTFFMHTQFRHGRALLLTTRDGNNNILLLCWLICLKEDASSYDYFAKMCVAVGLGRYLNKMYSLLYSDQAKGIPAFAKLFRCYHGFCFRHLIDNCYDHLKRTPGAKKSYNIALAWKMQKAKTQLEYVEAKAALHASNPDAAAYFDGKPHRQVFLYAMLELGVSPCGHKTSNVVESINGTIVEIRNESPYFFNDELLKWIGQQLLARSDEIARHAAKHYTLTKWAHDQWAYQVCAHCAHCAHWAHCAHCAPLHA